MMTGPFHESGGFNPDLVSSQAVERYIPLGLQFNPFPASGLAPDNPKMGPLPEVDAKLLRFFRGFLADNTFRGLVIRGEYGSGKTHHLKYITHLFDGSVLARAVYLKNPGLEAYQVIRGILDEIGPENFVKMLWTVIFSSLGKSRTEQGGQFYQQFAPRKQANLMAYLLEADDLTDYRRFLDAFDRAECSRDQLHQYVVRTLAETITADLDLADEFAAMAVFSGYRAFSAWKNLTVRGQKKQLAKPEQEHRFLSAVLKLLERNGILRFVVMIDEFEEIVASERLTKKQAADYLYTLRFLLDDLWDRHALAVVLACTPAAWEATRSLYPAIGERFSEELDLPFLSEAEATKVVADYLALARTSSSESPLAPLPANFMAKTPAEVRRNPRSLVKLCYFLIELAAEAGATEVSDKMVQDGLSRINPVWEERL